MTDPTLLTPAQRDLVNKIYHEAVSPILDFTEVLEASDEEYPTWFVCRIMNPLVEFARQHFKEELGKASLKKEDRSAVELNRMNA